MAKVVEQNDAVEAERAFEYLRERGVQHLVHFTPVENLPGILTRGLLPRHVLEEEEQSFQFNDEMRLDSKTSVNLSITNPNINLFYKFGRDYPKRTYAVITIDPAIIKKCRHAYSATNAASKKAFPCSIEELFLGDRPDFFERNWTTDNQAEILIKESIDPKFITSIQFSHSTKDEWEQTKSLVSDDGLQCEVVLCDKLFNYNTAPLGEKTPKATFEYYFISWQADIEDFEEIEREIKEFEWNKLFDSVSVHIDDLSTQNVKDQRSSKNTVKWSMRFFRPEEVRERTDNELSAIAVIEKIIHRGRVTVLSKELENTMADRADINKAHQIQSAIVELAKQQKLVSGMSLYFELLDKGIGINAIEDIKVLSANVSVMYRCPDILNEISVAESSDTADLVFKWSELDEKLPKNMIVITDSFNASQEISFDFTRVNSPVDICSDQGILEFLLNYIFRFEKFRENQIDGIKRGLSRQDSIILLPTGSGKSIVFQLLSLITPGISFVVSPIISLIDDQIVNLEQRGIDRVIGLSSAMDSRLKKIALEDLAKGQHLMCYVSPERFQDKRFIDAIKYYSRTNLISVIAIDEAHCVSEWGHDFRTAYLGLAQTCRDICRTDESVPPLLALTGTASASVLLDMQRDLDITDDLAVIEPLSFDRSEIHYRIIDTKSDDKQRVLQDLIMQIIPSDFNQQPNAFHSTDMGDDTNCGVVFCQHVNGKYGLMASARQKECGHLGVWDSLEKMLPGKVGLYSGGKPNQWTGRDWSTAKREYATSFKNNHMPVMVATKAFGMGIDKPNIRWVIHYGIPSSLESYYQEVGRAARDQRRSYAYLILSNDFPELNREMLNPGETPIESIESLENKKGQWKDDDISRTMHFHKRTFDGIGKEVDRAKKVLAACGRDNWVDGQWRISFDEKTKSDIEKAIYRFKLLGVFKGYTVDYSGYGRSGYFFVEPNQFNRSQLVDNYLKYIESYQSDTAYLTTAESALWVAVENISDDRDFIIKIIEHLLREFTYRVIEEGRRRATLTLLEAAHKAASSESDSESDSIFRQELLAYLSTDNAKKLALRSVLNRATDTNLLLRLLDESPTVDERKLLLGQSSRLLEAYPQHYGLHFIQSATYLTLSEHERCHDSLKSALRFGMENYGIETERCADDLIEYLNSNAAAGISAENLSLSLPLISALLNMEEDALLSRLTTSQAQALRKTNRMFLIAACIRKGRQWK